MGGLFNLGVGMFSTIVLHHIYSHKYSARAVFLELGVEDGPDKWFANFSSTLQCPVEVMTYSGRV